MGKADSTFILHPEGLSDITFDTLEAGSTGYYVPAETIRFNEHQREEIVYSEGPNVDGGKYISSHGPLVPVTFTCLCHGTTRATAIQNAQSLKRAIGNDRGGTLEYKPEGITTRSTFYHYVKSSIPKLVDDENNLWGGTNKHNQALGQIYVMMFDVELMTHPIATSDPDNLISLSLSRSTLTDTFVAGATYNYFDITGTDIKGDLPASLYFLMRNSQTDAFEKIGKVFLTTRSAYYSTLLNVTQLYEAEDASVISQTVHWSAVADANRSGGDYRRCNPPDTANDFEQVLRFTINNETDHRGRIGVVACVRAASGHYDNWEFKIRYRAASGIVSESDATNSVEFWGAWHLVYCGDMDFPPTPIDPRETVTSYIDMVFTRSDGQIGDYLDIDFIALMFLDEPSIQFLITDGFSNDQKLLSYNSPGIDSIAHIVDQSTTELDAVVDRHFGSLGLLAYPQDTRVFVLFERASNPLIDDDFDTYESQYWQLVESFEDDTGWVFNDAEFSAVDFVEGDGALLIDHATDGIGYGEKYFDPSEDMDADNRFTSADFCCFAGNPADYTKIVDATTFIFAEPSPWTSYYSMSHGTPPLSGEYEYTANGWNFEAVKKSAFGSGGGFPDWSDIGTLRITSTSSAAYTTLYIDYLRFEKADPDDSDSPNATGTAWDFQPSGGQWTITKDGPDGSLIPVLACLDEESNVEKTAVCDTTLPDDIIGYCKVCTRTDSGKAGITFRVSDQTAGSEDLYAFLIDFANDEVEINEYTAGSSNSLEDPVSKTVTTDTWYWMGFHVSGSNFQLFFTSTAPTGTTKSSKMKEVCTAENRVFSTSDATISSGQFGVMSIGTLARFDEAYIAPTNQIHDPTDQVTVSASALFRTIYPFQD